MFWGSEEFASLLGNDFSLRLLRHYIKCQRCCRTGPGRWRVMLLASGFPIKTILINQSLRDGSNLKPWFSLSKIAGHHPVTSDGARLSCPFTISSLWSPRTREGQSPCDSHLKLIWPLEISSHPEPDCHIGEKIQLNFLFVQASEGSCTRTRTALSLCASCCRLVHMLKLYSQSSARV